MNRGLPCRSEEVFYKVRILSDKPHTGIWLQIGLHSRRDCWSLYLSLLNPIRWSHSITPCIQGMRTAISKLHSYFCQLVVLLTLQSIFSLCFFTPHQFSHFLTLLDIVIFFQIHKVREVSKKKKNSYGEFVIMYPCKDPKMTIAVCVKYCSL